MDEIRKLVETGNLDEALALFEDRRNENPDDAEVLYELGCLYWKKQDWKHCLDCYSEAMRLNPDSPASEARKMVLDILQFYNKEMFNV